MFKEFSELRHLRSFRRVFLPLSATFFIYMFGWGVVSPIFSIYVNEVTGSATLTGLVLSLTTMAGIALNIPFGILEDRLNMKQVLQAPLLAYAGLAVLYPFAHTLALLLLLSVARGIASSFLWLTSWAYVLSYAEKQVKGKETGFFSDMNDLASAVAPVLGGSSPSSPSFFRSTSSPSRVFWPSVSPPPPFMSPRRRSTSRGPRRWRRSLGTCAIRGS